MAKEYVKKMLAEYSDKQNKAERIREAGRPERMRILASKEHLDFNDWAEITETDDASGNDRFSISEKGVRFVGWDKDFINSYPEHERLEMRRQMAEPGLSFPCTPKELCDFVDGGMAHLYGCFDVPDEFRKAAEEVACKAQEEVERKAKVQTTHATAKVAIAKAIAAGNVPISLSAFPGAGFPAPYGPDDKMYYGAKKLPDWDYWQHMPEVEYWQACALALDIDPYSLERHPQGWMTPGKDLFTPESFRGKAQGSSSAQDEGRRARVRFEHPLAASAK